MRRLPLLATVPIRWQQKREHRQHKSPCQPTRGRGHRRRHTRAWRIGKSKKRVHPVGASAEINPSGTKRAYALQRKSAARTRERNCSGVSGGGAGGGALAGFGFTTAGAAVFAAFFAAVRAASRARCLVAKSFALASTISADDPSRAMRWSWESTAWQ
jgi:hypothetical protein